MRKKTILVIGLGRFGRHLASRFAQLGNEVMVVDASEQRVNDILPRVASGQIGDCTNVNVLKSLGITNFDICFVCVGSNFQAAIEITSQLKDLGAHYVISKANRELHEKFLLRNGADEVVYPERESAFKTAMRTSADSLFDYIELTDEYCIAEIPTFESWAGKTIGQVGIRLNYKINILATKYDNQIYPLPGPKHIFKSHEHLIVAASKDQLVKLLKKLQ